MYKFLILFNLSILFIPIQAQHKKHFFAGFQRDSVWNIHIGIELAELAQNHFRRIGVHNYTFFIGQRFPLKKVRWLGWEFMSINAELSHEHLANPKQVCCIDGDRSDLQGKINYQRLFADFYPVDIQIGHIHPWRRYVLSIRPIFSAGFGYSRWFFEDTAAAESYDLQAFNMGGGFRLRTELFEMFFMENPVFDFAFIVAKNRPVKGQIGKVYINRPNAIAITSIWKVGVRIPLQWGFLKKKKKQG